MIKNISLSLLLVFTLSAKAEDVSESLTADDLGTFFIKKLNLTEKESLENADILFSKGIALYAKKGETRTVEIPNQKAIQFTTSDNKRESMKYLIASGLLGNAKAAVIAMKWLNQDGFIKGSREWRYALAEILHKKGFLYGTYILGLGYHLGNGIARDRELTIYYLGIVKDYCMQMPEDAYLSLSSDLLNEKDEQKLNKNGKMKCHLATNIYNSAKNTEFVTTKPITDKLKKQYEYKTKLRNALIKKQESASKVAEQ